MLNYFDLFSRSVGLDNKESENNLLIYLDKFPEAQSTEITRRNSQWTVRECTFIQDGHKKGFDINFSVT